MGMRMQQSSWRRSAIALLCTYGLILHAVLLALGSGLAAAPSPLPQHVLCLPSGATGGDSQGKPEHGPLCCALGCLASANAIPPVPVMVLPLRSGDFVEAAPPAAPQAAATFGHLAYPLGARAPPILT